MRYWIERSTGRLIRPAAPDALVTDSRFALTDDVVDLPGPSSVCVWDGMQCVIDPVLVGEFKARLLARIDELSVERVAARVTTPFGTFRISRDDIERYIGIGFAALFARLFGQQMTVTVRDINGAQISLDRDQLLRVLAEIGGRYYAIWQAAETRKSQILAATPEELKRIDVETGWDNDS